MMPNAKRISQVGGALEEGIMEIGHTRRWECSCYCRCGRALLVDGTAYIPTGCENDCGQARGSPSAKIAHCCCCCCCCCSCCDPFSSSWRARRRERIAGGGRALPPRSNISS